MLRDVGGERGATATGAGRDLGCSGVRVQWGAQRCGGEGEQRQTPISPPHHGGGDGDTAGDRRGRTLMKSTRVL